MSVGIVWFRRDLRLQDNPALQARDQVKYEKLERALAEALGKRFGQQFVVDNRPGASGIIATEITSKAPPDGYTLLLVTTSYGVNPALYKKLPYDPKAFAPIALVASVEIVLMGDEHPPTPVHLISPQGRSSVPKVRAFMDFAVPLLRGHFARLAKNVTPARA